jgi:hypothetical protein
MEYVIASDPRTSTSSRWMPVADHPFIPTTSRSSLWMAVDFLSDSMIVSTLIIKDVRTPDAHQAERDVFG